MPKIIYVDTVTHIPAAWANDAGNLIYDVFNAAKNVPEARKRLGIGTLALQNSDSISITGGSINDTVIGNLIPKDATFLNAKVTELTPATPGTLTSKHYVDNFISETFAQLNLQDMSRQRSNAVNITGGYGIYDTLRVRNPPATALDVLTLGFYQASLQPIQGMLPFVIAPDNHTVTLPFPVSAGKLVVFVDGIYQIPDQYSFVNVNTIDFVTALPIGSIVGGFKI